MTKKMTKRVKLEETQWYPVITLEDDPSEFTPEWGIDMPQEVIGEFKRRFAEFASLQDELRVWLAKQYAGPAYHRSDD